MSTVWDSPIFVVVVLDTAPPTLCLQQQMEHSGWSKNFGVVNLPDFASWLCHLPIVCFWWVREHPRASLSPSVTVGVMIVPQRLSGRLHEMMYAHNIWSVCLCEPFCLRLQASLMFLFSPCVKCYSRLCLAHLSISHST